MSKVRNAALKLERQQMAANAAKGFGKMRASGKKHDNKTDIDVAYKKSGTKALMNDRKKKGKKGELILQIMGEADYLDEVHDEGSVTFSIYKEIQLNTELCLTYYDVKAGKPLNEEEFLEEVDKSQSFHLKKNMPMEEVAMDILGLSLIHI